MVEAPGTAPGSEWFIAAAIYRHSRQAGSLNIEAKGSRRKGGRAVLQSFCWVASGASAILMPRPSDICSTSLPSPDLIRGLTQQSHPLPTHPRERRAIAMSHGLHLCAVGRGTGRGQMRLELNRADQRNSLRQGIWLG